MLENAKPEREKGVVVARKGGGMTDGAQSILRAVKLCCMIL